MKLRIAEVRKEKKLTQRQVADKLDLHWTNYNKLEKGHSDVTLQRLYEIAQILEVRPEELIARLPQRVVRVRGYVQAGHFAESHEWPDDDRYDVAIADDAQFRGVPLFAVETRGPSMDRIYPEGTVLICTDFQRAPETPVFGKRYIIERVRPDGQRETTVKTLSRDSEGALWLVPESNDPRFFEAIPLKGEEGDEIRILGRVCYSVRPE